VAAPIEGRFDAYDSSRARRTFGAAVNLAGVPGIAVPNGFGERGLPTSLCITTPALEENKALQIAHLYQLRTDWHRRYPDL
jgi:aspartyl-tRNA(Asn)/glutamyl-tRNA(Gln) amidotransferase subunit A